MVSVNYYLCICMLAESWENLFQVTIVSTYLLDKRALPSTTSSLKITWHHGQHRPINNRKKWHPHNRISLLVNCQPITIKHLSHFVTSLTHARPVRTHACTTIINYCYIYFPTAIVTSDKPSDVSTIFYIRRFAIYQIVSCKKVPLHI